MHVRVYHRALIACIAEGARVMRKIKIFKGVESELVALEQEVNAWVEQEGAEIVAVTGNIAPQTPQGTIQGTFSASDVLVIVTYEEKHV
jgi:hypothetical protein